MLSASLGHPAESVQLCTVVYINSIWGKKSDLISEFHNSSTRCHRYMINDSSHVESIQTHLGLCISSFHEHGEQFETSDARSKISKIFLRAF